MESQLEVQSAFKSDEKDDGNEQCHAPCNEEVNVNEDSATLCASHNQPPRYPSYCERAFSLHRIPANPDLDYLRHPSGVIILQLRAQHAALKAGVQSVTFDTGNKNKKGKDRSQQSVVGKGKKGGLKLQETTKICVLNCRDGTQHTIRSGLRATLIEVNPNLIDQPQLLHSSRQKRGYLAIVIPPAIINNHKNKVPKSFESPFRVGTELSMSMLGRNGSGEAGNVDDEAGDTADDEPMEHDENETDTV